MTAIVAVAGLISALILFRWARTLALFTVAGAILYALAGCAPNPNGGMGLALIPGPPDIMGCINRGSPWVWDNLTKQCVTLPPDQLAQMHHDNDAAWNRSIEARQAAANDPRMKALNECAAWMGSRRMQRYSGEFLADCSALGVGR